VSHRTQIVLTDEQYERLQARSVATGASLGALVREAVDRAYPRWQRPDPATVREVLDQVAGLWADRSDEEIEALERSLRPGLESKLRSLTP
jgi:acyl-CoA reductase-like NAD-dependent aldehyde dehydrogenase